MFSQQFYVLKRTKGSVQGTKAEVDALKGHFNYSSKVQSIRKDCTL